MRSFTELEGLTRAALENIEITEHNVSIAYSAVEALEGVKRIFGKSNPKLLGILTEAIVICDSIIVKSE